MGEVDHTLAFVFPGQGSQTVGMLQAMADTYSIVGETFTQAGHELGFDLWAMVQGGPAEDLGHTENTQPAMLTAGVALWRVWQQESGVWPAYMAGHSLGEYTALVCAGAITFEDAVGLVAERGRLMERAVPSGQGTMAAILGLDDESVREVCVAAADGQVVEAVNLNAPGQVAIAGHVAAVQRAMDIARERGARKAVQLPVSGPFHSSLMAEAAASLAARLEQIEIRPPQIEVLHNVDTKSRHDADAIRRALVAQLSSPVLWVGIVQAMTAAGVKRIVECGPGKVLAGLCRRVDRSLESAPLFDPVTLDKTLTLVAGREG